MNVIPRWSSRLRNAIFFTALVSGPHLLFSQGVLTPPGAPAPTMKTLDQIEARTPISSLPYTISSRGSYYLTKNLNVTTGDAITINANQVTLDLNGFTISSTAPSAAGTAILLFLGVSDITILNGHIRGGVTYSFFSYTGPGFANGIYCSTTASNSRVSGISVSGCLTNGIYLGGNSIVVDSCTVQTIGGDGILAPSVLRSAAYECGSHAIYANNATDCHGTATGSGTGVYASFVANNCYGGSDTGTGLSAAAANNCYGFSGTGNGVESTIASNCYGSSLGSTGVYTTVVANNCYGKSYGGYGVFSSRVAIGCVGENTATSGVGLWTVLANSCVGLSFSGGAPTVYSYHYNMPPSPQTP